MNKYLVLENGMCFQGYGFGAEGEVIAEVVFTTAMAGYLETLTDPSYIGQAVLHTFPLIGNYGVIPEDFENGKPGAAAYIVREYCDKPSNFRSEGTFDELLKERGVVGLYGIDTRALTRVLRENGTMNGIITSDPESVDLEKVKNYRISNPVKLVSTKAPECIGEGGKYKIAVMDYGKKKPVCDALLARNCELHIFPCNASAEDVLAVAPDGIVLTDGPGDPKDNADAVETLKKFIANKMPVMGICLGHQMLALANGFDTEKLKYGHRGANQPVRNEKGEVYITSQNHGYAVVADSIDPAVAVQSFVNVNDGTDEGLRYLNAPMFSTQFHPAVCGGAHDTRYLFDKFIEMVEEGK